MNRTAPSSKRYLVLCLMGALILASCGGGDSGTVPPPANPPVVVSGSPPPPAGVVTHPYEGFSFSADGGSPPFTWSVSSGALPGGLTLAPDGTLSGTPTAAGSFAFTVKATDSASTPGTGTQPFTVTVAAPGPLVITPGQTPPAGVHDTDYGSNGFAFTADGGYFPLNWAVTAGALPPGLTLNPDGSLSGTPTTPSPTPFAFTVTVTDSSTPTRATNSAAYTITVSEPPPPSINNTPPPTATVGSPYTFQFTASDGLAPLVWTPPTEPLGGLAVGLDGVLSGTPSTAGMFPITLMVKDALNQSSPPTPFTVRIALARPAAGFTQTSSMVSARSGHTATRLLDGRVLIAGGGVAIAELYDPRSRTFTATGSLTLTMNPHSATLLAKSTLPNYGKVLVTDDDDQTAELYDPVAGAFTATGSMTVARARYSATLLPNGQVLVAGGGTASAELFNPSTGTFTATGSMTVARTDHSATLLPDGRVLIAGGANSDLLASAELYDPASGKFVATGSMSEGRAGHTATLLADGTVLITGTDYTAELFSPGTGTFSALGDRYAGPGATATLRHDGTVLVAGGVHRTSSRSSSSLSRAMLFAPESGGFVDTGSLLTARYGHTATLLDDGTVLVTGGAQHFCYCSSSVLSSAELFQ